MTALSRPREAVGRGGGCPGHNASVSAKQVPRSALRKPRSSPGAQRVPAGLGSVHIQKATAPCSPREAGRTRYEGRVQRLLW